MTKTNSYRDLGIGWFLATSSNGMECALLDGLAVPQDHFFGAAAWSGKIGPSGGRALVRIQNTGAVDYWAACQAHAYEDGLVPPMPCLWPGTVTVTSAGIAEGLGYLQEMQFDSANAFLAAIQPILSARLPRVLPELTSAERLAVFAACLP